MISHTGNPFDTEAPNPDGCTTDTSVVGLAGVEVDDGPVVTMGESVVVPSITRKTL